MNHPFSSAPIYAPTYQSNHQQSAPSSIPQSHRALSRAISGTHPLPPLTSGNHAASAFGNDTYPTRSQPLQPSLTHDLVSQPGSYPVYAPTANTFYNGQSANYSQPSQNQQLNHPSRPPSVTGLPQPVYTSALRQSREILPMPSRGNGKVSLGSIADGTNQLDGVEEPPPTHVVGSQGRRGILPSAAGRPVAVAGANTSGQKAAPTPEKDDDGKYPCKHCTKTYLHAKHLKRHLLRHTGVRPYTCGLCKDTFSRSDILKRHFMKCSVRRGNPSGESHLSHSRANKKSRQEDAARMENSTPTGVSQAQQMEPVFSPTSLDAAFDISALHLGRQYVEREIEKQVSRPNSIKKSKRSTGSRSNRASLGIVNPSGFDPTSYGYVSGHVTPDSATTSGAATPFTYLHDSRSNQISPSGAFSTANGSDMGFGGASRAPSSSNYSNGSLPHIAGQRGGHDIDWHSFAPYSSHDDYSNMQYPSGTNTPITAQRIKSEADLTNIQIEEYSYLQSKA